MTRKQRSRKTMSLSDIGEGGLIRIFRRRWRGPFAGVILGIGDDSAAVTVKDGRALITSDMMLEKIHFDLSYTTFYQLGYKLLAVNISDIFAMGGEPRFFLVNMGIPEYCGAGDIEELYRGIQGMARKFGVAVVGGDTCASRYGLVLSGTLVGEGRNMISRSGARPGDAIFVTGKTGDSAMGLMLLKRMGKRAVRMVQGKECTERGQRLRINGTSLLCRDVCGLVRRHVMPSPVPVRKTAGIHAMTDISDGLLTDLSHICDESKVGAMVYTERVPLSRELSLIAGKLGLDPLDLSLRGGEDYVLLFTASPKTRVENALPIGEITSRGRFLVDGRGEKTPFHAEGYEHFEK